MKAYESYIGGAQKYVTLAMRVERLGNEPQNSSMTINQPIMSTLSEWPHKNHRFTFYALGQIAAKRTLGLKSHVTVNTHDNAAVEAALNQLGEAESAFRSASDIRAVQYGNTLLIESSSMLLGFGIEQKMVRRLTNEISDAIAELRSRTRKKYLICSIGICQWCCRITSNRRAEIYRCAWHSGGGASASAQHAHRFFRRYGASIKNLERYLLIRIDPWAAGFYRYQERKQILVASPSYDPTIYHRSPGGTELEDTLGIWANGDNRFIDMPSLDAPAVSDKRAMVLLPRVLKYSGVARMGLAAHKLATMSLSQQEKTEYVLTIAHLTKTKHYYAARILARAEAILTIAYENKCKATF